MCRIVISGLPGSKTFVYINSQTTRFSRKKKIIEHKMCVLIFSTTLYETFLILRKTACAWVVRSGTHKFQALPRAQE
jgi:hypothetical protein